eukprot:SAG22_NODE_1690_length_3806_cov_1.980577_4_plen_217_part_00
MHAALGRRGGRRCVLVSVQCSGRALSRARPVAHACCGPDGRTCVPYFAQGAGDFWLEKDKLECVLYYVLEKDPRVEGLVMPQCTIAMKQQQKRRSTRQEPARRLHRTSARELTGQRAAGLQDTNNLHIISFPPNPTHGQPNAPALRHLQLSSSQAGRQPASQAGRQAARQAARQPGSQAASCLSQSVRACWLAGTVRRTLRFFVRSVCSVALRYRA